jgi:membrane-associated phospholipid phosphatase
MQRMVGGYHYLSDTFWGAAVGWVCAGACLPGGWFSPVFDRLEARLSSSI